MIPAFRPARRADIPAIAALLDEDDLGSGRKSRDFAPYRAAFDTMRSEVGTTVIVGELDGRVIADYQWTLITGLPRGGARRAQIESVRAAGCSSSLATTPARARTVCTNASAMPPAISASRCRWTELPAVPDLGP